MDISTLVALSNKNMRNVWGEINTARVNNYTVPVTISDPGADRVVGTGDDQTFQTQALAAGVGDTRVMTNLGKEGNADFQTMEFAQMGNGSTHGKAVWG